MTSGTGSGKNRISEYLVQALMRFLHSSFHAGLCHAIAVRHRLEDGLYGHSRSVVGKRFEFRRFENDVSRFRQSIELEGLDHPLRRSDIVDYPMEHEFIAMVVGMDIPVGSAAARLESVDLQRELTWPAPLNQELRI